jgi:hypothetical protein
MTYTFHDDGSVTVNETGTTYPTARLAHAAVAAMKKLATPLTPKMDRHAYKAMAAEQRGQA